jgi:hypothetical protein
MEIQTVDGRSYNTAVAEGYLGLQCSAVAANALHDIAAVTQIPFLDRFSMLFLTVIPIVQVWQ